MPKRYGSDASPASANAPTSPALGQVYFDTDTAKLYFWNGAAWIDTAAGGNSAGVPVTVANVAGTVLIGSGGGVAAYRHTLTGDVTYQFSPDAVADTECIITIEVRQNEAGGHAVTFPSSVQWSNDVVPVFTESALHYDVVVLRTTDGGTSWQGAMFANDAVVPSPPAAPSAPLSLDAVAGQSSVAISWAAPAVANPDVIDYQLWRKVGAGAYEIRASGITGTSYNDNSPSLTPGTTYTYKVRARNGYDSGGLPDNAAYGAFSNEDSAVPTSPGSSSRYILTDGSGRAWAPGRDSNANLVTLGRHLEVIATIKTPASVTGASRMILTYDDSFYFYIDSAGKLGLSINLGVGDYFPQVSVGTLSPNTTLAVRARMTIANVTNIITWEFDSASDETQTFAPIGGTPGTTSGNGNNISTAASRNISLLSSFNHSSGQPELSLGAGGRLYYWRIRKDWNQTSPVICQEHNVRDNSADQTGGGGSPPTFPLDLPNNHVVTLQDTGIDVASAA